MYWPPKSLVQSAGVWAGRAGHGAERSYRRARAALLRPARPRIWYVVDNAGWSNEWDGRYITDQARRCGLDASVAYHCDRAEGDIIHFGSTWSFLEGCVAGKDDRNAVVATIFHGDRSNDSPELARAMEDVLSRAEHLSCLVTSCSLMLNRFKGWGVNEEILRMIPLGIDLSRFMPADNAQRNAIRAHLGIPAGAVCIGSFQKDGVGWGDGNEPKLIKGPDIFIEAVAQLKREMNDIVVLLTGPARGYVKRQLDLRNIPFRHFFVDDYGDIPSYYQALDLYLVTSREEGGPKAILEAMASGVPLVSTRVGMAPDVIEDGINGRLVGIGDVEALAGAALGILSDSVLRNKVVINGLQTVEGFSWRSVGQRYVDEVYRPLIELLTA